MIGGIRNEEDRILFEAIIAYSKELKIFDRLEMKPDLPFKEMLKEFSSAKVGIHTMLEEHFGISIVEMMAAGLYTIAHNSGGPKDDIIGEQKLPCG